MEFMHSFTVESGKSLVFVVRLLTEIVADYDIFFVSTLGRYFFLVIFLTKLLSICNIRNEVTQYKMPIRQSEFSQNSMKSLYWAVESKWNLSIVSILFCDQKVQCLIFLTAPYKCFFTFWSSQPPCTLRK